MDPMHIDVKHGLEWFNLIVATLKAMFLTFCNKYLHNNQYFIMPFQV
jgi:hypothetical protein